MAKYSAQDVFQDLDAHLDVLQRTLAAHQPQAGLMASVKPAQWLLDATAQLTHLASSKTSLHRHVDALVSALERLPVGVLVFDEEGRLALINQAGESMLGMHGVELPLEQWPELDLFATDRDETPLPPAYLPFSRTLSTGEHSEAEVFSRSEVRPDGVWLKLSAFPIASAQNVISGAVCVISDVTSTHLEQHVLRELSPSAGKEQRAEMILQRSTEAFIAIDLHGVITDWNETSEAILGFKSREIVGRNLRDTVVPAAYRSLFDAAIGQLFEKGRAGLPLGRAEVPSMHADGRERTIKISVFYVSANGVETIGGFFEDVTQRTRTEQRKNARYAVTRIVSECTSFEELAPKMVHSITANIDWEIGLLWLIDPATKTLRCNQYWHQNASLDAFVRRTQELQITRGQGMLGRIWADGECEFVEDLRVSENDPQAKLAEMAGMHSSIAFPVSSNWELEAIFQFIHFEAQSDEEMISLMKDTSVQISQFVDASKAIVARQRLVAIVEASDDAMISLSLSGVINSWNNGATKMYGWDAPSVVGKDVSILSPSETETEGRQALSEVRASRTAKRIETRHVTRQNKVIDVAVTISPVVDASGRVISIGFTARDVSQRKEQDRNIHSLNKNLEEQVQKLAFANQELSLLQSDTVETKDQAVASLRFKSEFLAKMSREIRTPMNAIMGLSEVLSKSKSLAPQEREYVSIIRESGASLLNVFDDIIEYSKIEDGDLALEVSDFSLTSLVESAGDSITAQAYRKRLSLTTFVAPDIPLIVRGDADKVNKVLVKLLESTFKYMERGGAIIRAVQEPSSDGRCHVRIIVSDVGVGLSAITRTQVQKPTISDEGSQRFDATKLGLTLTKHLVEAMGGRIGVEPNSTGSGASFWAVIPFEKVMDVPAAAAEPSFNGRKILVIDGPTGAARIVHAYAESWGLKCDWVLTAEEGLSILKSQSASNTPYDIVVMENVTFGMSGHLLARTIKEAGELQSTDVLFYGPFLDEADAAELASVNVSSIMSGPLKESALRHEITSLLRRRPEIKPLAMQSALVLIADDNHINRKVTSLQLASLGLTAHVVCNGREAVEAADKNLYAMILMDCEMPEMDGFMATRTIRRIEATRGRKTPIVAMTANASEGDREQCIESGMDDYMSQPVETERLASALKKWVPAQLLAGVMDNLNAAISSGADKSPQMSTHAPAPTVIPPFARAQPPLTMSEPASVPLPQPSVAEQPAEPLPLAQPLPELPAPTVEQIAGFATHDDEPPSIHPQIAEATQIPLAVEAEESGQFYSQVEQHPAPEPASEVPFEPLETLEPIAAPVSALSAEPAESPLIEAAPTLEISPEPFEMQLTDAPATTEVSSAPLFTSEPETAPASEVQYAPAAESVSATAAQLAESVDSMLQETPLAAAQASPPDQLTPIDAAALSSLPSVDNMMTMKLDDLQEMAAKMLWGEKGSPDLAQEPPGISMSAELADKFLLPTLSKAAEEPPSLAQQVLSQLDELDLGLDDDEPNDDAAVDAPSSAVSMSLSRQTRASLFDEPVLDSMQLQDSVEPAPIVLASPEPNAELYPQPSVQYETLAESQSLSDELEEEVAPQSQTQPPVVSPLAYQQTALRQQLAASLAIDDPTVETPAVEPNAHQSVSEPTHPAAQIESAMRSMAGMFGDDDDDDFNFSETAQASEDESAVNPEVAEISEASEPSFEHSEPPAEQMTSKVSVMRELLDAYTIPPLEAEPVAPEALESSFQAEIEHRTADPAARMKSLFSSDSDDDDFDFGDADPTPSSSPPSTMSTTDTDLSDTPSAPPVVAAQAAHGDQTDASYQAAPTRKPSAELAALFDSVMDEELNQFDDQPPLEQTDSLPGAPVASTSVDSEEARQRALLEAELNSIADIDDSDEEDYLAHLEPSAERVELSHSDIQRSQFEAELRALQGEPFAEPAPVAAEPIAKETNGSHNGDATELQQTETDPEEIEKLKQAAAASDMSANAQAAFEQYLRQAQGMPPDAENVLNKQGTIRPVDASTSNETPSVEEALVRKAIEQAMSSEELGPRVEQAPQPVASVTTEAPKTTAVQQSDPLEPMSSTAATADQLPPIPMPATRAFRPVGMKPAMPPFRAQQAPSVSQEVAPEPPSSSSPAVESAADQSPAVEEAMMDLTRLLRICGEAGTREIIHEFITSSQRLMDELEISVLDKNEPDRKRLAHELTGSCSALGAKQVQDLAMSMQLLNGEESDKSKAMMKQLKQSYDRLRAQLIPYLKQ